MRLDGSWIIDTDVDARTTLGRMARLVRQAMADPRVIYSANQVIAAVPQRDLLAQVTAIYDFLKSTFHFVPNPVGTQTIRPPGWTSNPAAPGMLEDVAARGITQGACDDAAVLAAALGMANGLPARFRAVAFCYDIGHCDPLVAYTHVIADLSVGEAWLPLDVTRPDDLTRPPTVIRTLTLDVA